jgi:hypothetical protein
VLEPSSALSRRQSAGMHLLDRCTIADRADLDHFLEKLEIIVIFA